VDHAVAVRGEDRWSQWIMPWLYAVRTVGVMG
jgi:hypothetical protein